MKEDAKFERLDRSIDRLVYDLYGLMEEVKTVEESLGSEYERLPSREEVYGLIEECEKRQDEKNGR